MNKSSKLISLILSILLIGGCTNKQIPSENTNTENNSAFDTSDDPVNDVSDNGTTNDYDSESFSEEDVETPSEYDGENVQTISEPGKYLLSGELGPVSITVAKNKVVYLFLDGVSINSNEGIALASENKITLYIVLLNGKENNITNDFLDTNAVHIKGDVHILGNGTLNIESKQKNGLKVSKDLYISDETVTLNVIGANHAISARSLIASDATINVIAKGKDGVQLEVDSDVTEFTTEQGFARLTNVNFTSDSYGDGIQANTYLYISSGTYDITTHGVFVSYSQENMETYGLETDDFKFVASGDSYKRVAKDEIRSLSSRYYALTQSVKGLKVSEIETTDGYLEGEYDIYIAHGAKINIDSTDDCIHTNYGDVTIEESNLFLSTFDDGVHADYNTNINNAHIEVYKSYEGLEGAVVTVDGNKTNLVIYSQDDGINAASDLSDENNIYIKDGYLRVYASGDGLDANTGLYLEGGEVIVEGPGQMNGSLDAEQVYFNGAIVFACSTNGMRERMSATQNTIVYQGTTTMYANSEITIVEEESEKVVYSYTLRQSCTQIIISHGGLEIGKYYLIKSGTTTIATIKQASTLTTVGSSGGPGGGPGGPGF